MTSESDVPSITLPSGTIPILGFGTWQIQGQDAYQAVRSALAAGYRHIDTATVYENEQQVGQALHDSGVARAEVFVTTKLPPDQRRPPGATFEASLAALQTDYVDLWLIHWTPQVDSAVALWKSMLEIRDEGRARNVGVSNFSLSEIDELISATGVAPAVNQIRWSPFLHDPQVTAGLRTRDVVLEGYSPFQASRLDDALLCDVAAAHHVSPAQVILRWHVQHGVVVIPKSTHRERIAENFAIFDFELDPAEMARIDGLGR